MVLPDYYPSIKCNPCSKVRSRRTCCVRVRVRACVRVTSQVGIVSKLGHPNICRFYAGCMKPKEGWMAFELLAMSLSDALHFKKKQFTDGH